MEIYINDTKADITLENEKNIGEVISNLEQWLQGSGHRLSGILVDGVLLTPSKLEEVFLRDIDSVQVLKLNTSSVADLAAESLLKILDDINEFQSLRFEEKSKFFENWKNSPQANFTSESMPDLYSVLISSFTGTGLNSNSVFSITEERLREVKEPPEELGRLKTILDDTCARLTDLSLDIQTGKELQAAGTIQLFSGVTEKLLRLANQLEFQGFLGNKETGEPYKQIIDELSKIIKELYDAYGRGDTVLVGDLAEYEACPKLQELYNALFNECRSLQAPDKEEK